MAKQPKRPHDPTGPASQMPDSSAEQHERFKQLARELGCDEDEVAFDQALKRVAGSKPAPKHEPKKRKPDIPTLVEHALYLITELASAMKRTKVADWPEDPSRSVSERLREISTKAE